MDRGGCNMSKIINVFDKLWLQKQSYCFFDLNNCSLLGLLMLFWCIMGIRR